MLGRFGGTRAFTSRDQLGMSFLQLQLNSLDYRVYINKRQIQQNTINYIKLGIRI